MAHEYEDSLKCPYCDHEHEEWWEICDNEDSGEIECSSCEERFTYEANRSISFNTRRVDCEDGSHKWEEWEEHRVSQETADRWNKERFCGRDNHRAYSYRKRDCLICDDTEYSEKVYS